MNTNENLQKIIKRADDLSGMNEGRTLDVALELSAMSQEALESAIEIEKQLLQELIKQQEFLIHCWEYVSMSESSWHLLEDRMYSINNLINKHKKQN